MTVKPEIDDFAEQIGIKALEHLAADPDLLRRFLNLSGIELAHLRQAVESPGFIGGLLDFYLNYEPDLMRLSAAIGIKPAEIARARSMLDPQGGQDA